jgi:hypothetical protein
MESQDAQLRASFQHWNEQRQKLLVCKEHLRQSQEPSDGDAAHELRRLQLQYESALTRLLQLLQQRRPR